MASIWSGERARKKEWICLSRPGQLTAILTRAGSGTRRMSSSGRTRVPRYGGCGGLAGGGARAGRSVASQAQS